MWYELSGEKPNLYAKIHIENIIISETPMIIIYFLIWPVACKLGISVPVITLIDTKTKVNWTNVTE